MARKPSARVLATILILFSGSLAGGGTFAQTNLTTEPNTNRPGHDYQSFNLDRPDPGLCRNRCAQDRRCQAYTYVNPGVQGPKT